MTPAAIRVGLRFDSADANRLRALADLVKSGEIIGDAQVYESAELAARTGEPMIVYCADPGEAHAMAAMYVLVGCRRPALDELTGHRPAK